MQSNEGGSMQDARTAHMTPATREWYAARSLKQLQHELRGARSAYADALPYRDTNFRARIMCESNELAIPMLEALIENFGRKGQ
jgi:hypothetical protein